jgi:hypothetical protein
MVAVAHNPAVDPAPFGRSDLAHKAARGRSPLRWVPQAMSHKRKGQLAVSGEWARHLRPFLRRAFWKKERQAVKTLVRTENASVTSTRPRRDRRAASD